MIVNTKSISSFILVLLAGPLAEASRIYNFSYRSLMGAGIGAGAGLISTVASDNPSGNINNIARGASLGLYGGIVWAIIADQEESNYSINFDGENLNFAFRF